MIDWSAGTYELTATQLAPAAERAVTAAGITPGERVLDVACGTGNAAILAAMGGAQVVGVDLAERLLEVAAGRARAAGVEIDWQPGDATALPVEDGAFDAVVSVFGVIFAPASAAAAELVRATAPGGRIVLTSWTGGGAIALGSGVLVRAMTEAGALPGGGDPRITGSATGPAAGTPDDLRPAADGPGTARDLGPATGDDLRRDPDDPRRDPGPAAEGAEERRAATRDWGDPSRLEGLFAAHGATVAITSFPVPFEAESAEALAEEWMDRHPMWLAGRDALGAEAYGALREPLVAVLEEGNEDPTAFRATSTALLVEVQLP